MSFYSVRYVILQGSINKASELEGGSVYQEYRLLAMWFGANFLAPLSFIVSLTIKQG